MARGNWKIYTSKKFIEAGMYLDKNISISVGYDFIKETDKAWILEVDQKTFIYPKSKTTHFPEKKILEVPKWLYEKNS